MEECITTGLGFWAYELGNSIFRRKFGRPPTHGERGVVGGLTACFVMTATLPLLVVSRRLQVGWLCLKSLILTEHCLGFCLLLLGSLPGVQSWCSERIEKWCLQVCVHSGG